MKCPGQDTQYWNKDAIFETACPECGHPMEFFKDEANRRCPGCKKKIVNPKMDFGCASYCRFSEQCLGTLPEEFAAQGEDLLKNRVADEMKKYFGTDFKRISHAVTVANFAEKIAKKEKANLPVVLCAAYLYDIGIKNAEEKYDRVTPENLDIESPKVAQQILEKSGAKKALIDDVVDLVSQHSRKKESADSNNPDKNVLHDADMLTHMAACEEKIDMDDQKFLAKLDRLFVTPSGNELAKQVLVE